MRFYSYYILIPCAGLLLSLFWIKALYAEKELLEQALVLESQNVEILRQRAKDYEKILEAREKSLEQLKAQNKVYAENLKKAQEDKDFYDWSTTPLPENLVKILN